MADYFSQLYRESIRAVNHWDHHAWLWALAAVVLVGFLCLRGFGSRTSY